jgi:hypothetical protein
MLKHARVCEFLCALDQNPCIHVLCACARARAIERLADAVFLNRCCAAQRRPYPPLWHIPSQRWCKYAVADDKTLLDGHGSNVGQSMYDYNKVAYP